jgi:hypothetical protein
MHPFIGPCALDFEPAAQDLDGLSPEYLQGVGAVRKVDFEKKAGTTRQVPKQKVVNYKLGR